MSTDKKSRGKWLGEIVVLLVSLAVGVLLVLSWLAVMAMFAGCTVVNRSSQTSPTNRTGPTGPAPDLAMKSKVQSPKSKVIEAPTRTGSSVAAAVLPPALSVEWDGQWPIYRLEYATSLTAQGGPPITWRTYAWLTNWDATRATNHWVQSVQKTNGQMFFRVAAAHL